MVTISLPFAHFLEIRVVRKLVGTSFASITTAHLFEDGKSLRRLSLIAIPSFFESELIC